MLEVAQYKSYVPEGVSNSQHYIEHVINSLKDNLSDQGVSDYPDEKLERDLIVALQKCESKGLNPVKGEIYFNYRVSSFKTAQGWIKRPSLVALTSIDALRLIAEKSNKYGGSDDAIHEYDENGKLKKSTITVYRLNPVNGERMPITASVMYHSYVGLKPVYQDKRKVGEEPNHFWTKMPEVMLAKCAEALALRKAFPNTAGMYINEEMQQADNDKPQRVKAEVKPKEPPTAAPSATNPPKTATQPATAKPAAKKPEPQKAEIIEDQSGWDAQLKAAKDGDALKAVWRQIPQTERENHLELAKKLRDGFAEAAKNG